MLYKLYIYYQIFKYMYIKMEPQGVSVDEWKNSISDKLDAIIYLLKVGTKKKISRHRL